MAQRYADDGFSRVLGDYLDKRINSLQQYMSQGAVPRDELCEFVYRTGKAIRKTIDPEKGSKEVQAWNNAKGMLKGIINFDKFSMVQKDASCVTNVLENKVLQILERYRTFVLTGEVTTKHVPPKLLGETDEILCVDKPSGFICSYGERAGQVPQLQRLESASALLNGEKVEIQIHEYLALKFDFECAQKTREWWALNATKKTCSCGKCPTCAATQTGCCNRLDKETSGVMIIAKTLAGFGVIREQFASEHSLEVGGTEKYYLALVHGKVELPKMDDSRHGKHWNHGLEPQPKGNPRGRIQIDCTWDAEKGRAACYDKGGGEKQHWKDKGQNGQWAITFYEPVAWFTHNATRKDMTLIMLQIVTGRRHQIRFHCAEIGHVLIGDPRYDAKCKDDRNWCPRVFLHSYCSKFREPFTERWFEATSPLPQDLTEIMEKNLTLENVQKPWLGPQLLSRRYHEKYQDFLYQYDQKKKPLLFTMDIAKDVVAKAMAASGATDVPQLAQQQSSNGSPRKKRRIIVPAQYAGLQPTTPPLQPQAPVPQASSWSALVPVAAAVPVAAIPAVAATAAHGWKRMSSRSQVGVFYYWNEQTGETSVEPPPPWELKASRSNAGVVYYWNPQTGQTSAEKPEV